MNTTTTTETDPTTRDAVADGWEYRAVQLETSSRWRVEVRRFGMREWESALMGTKETSAAALQSLYRHLWNRTTEIVSTRFRAVVEATAAEDARLESERAAAAAKYESERLESERIRAEIMATPCPKLTRAVVAIDGLGEIKAEVTGGLALHKSPRGECWDVSHLRTGKRVVRVTTTKTRARAIMGALLVRADWTVETPTPEMFAAHRVMKTTFPSELF